MNEYYDYDEIEDAEVETKINNDNSKSKPPKIPKSDSLFDQYKNDNQKVTISTIVDFLLKKPYKLIYKIKNPDGSNISFLHLILLILCMMIFGAINGFFSGGEQIFYAMGKYPLGVVLSLIICFPSYYIFIAMSGADVNFKEAFQLLLISLTLTSFLLCGFAPVLWIFSQSTNSLFFMGFLNLVFWISGLYFGFRLLFNGIYLTSKKKVGALKFWILIFILVSLQMTTTLRPLIGTSEKFMTNEKKFFLDHWLNQN